MESYRKTSQRVSAVCLTLVCWEIYFILSRPLCTSKRSMQHEREYHIQSAIQNTIGSIQERTPNKLQTMLSFQLLYSEHSRTHFSKISLSETISHCPKSFKILHPAEYNYSNLQLLEINNYNIL